MKRFVLPSVIGVCALAVPSSWFWSRAQSAALDARLSSCRDLAANAEQVLTLRGREERASLGERPKQDLIARVNATLAAVGIPRNALGGVTTEADGTAPMTTPGRTGTGAASDSGGEVRAQAMRVSLKGVQPSQLGAFLEKWRETQPLWTPTSFEVTRANSKDPATERFDASLVLSVIYLAPPRSDPKG